MPRRRSLGPIGYALYNILYWPYLIASLFLFFFPALAIFLFTFWQRPRRLLHAYTSRWAAHYVTCAPFAGVRVERRELGLTNGPCVYVVNHQSMVDILAVFATRLPFLWVSKRENFFAPFLGWNMRLNGYVPLRRKHLPSIRRMLRTCEARLSEGASLCVFPEGTRSEDRELKAFYRGAFWIAARCRVPVVPIVIEGTAEILPKGRFGIDPGPVVVRLLSPIHPEQAGNDDRRLREMVFQCMQQELARLRAREQNDSPVPASMPLIDAHEALLSVDRVRAWASLQTAIEGSFLLGKGGFPERRGSPHTTVQLRGSHLFAQYELRFDLEEAPLGTRIRATTHARFHKGIGTLYRWLVIDTGAHSWIVRRFLSKLVRSAS